MVQALVSTKVEIKHLQGIITDSVFPFKVVILRGDAKRQAIPSCAILKCYLMSGEPDSHSKYCVIIGRLMWIFVTVLK